MFLKPLCVIYVLHGGAPFGNKCNTFSASYKQETPILERAPRQIIKAYSIIAKASKAEVQNLATEVL